MIAYPHASYVFIRKLLQITEMCLTSRDGTRLWLSINKIFCVIHNKVFFKWHTYFVGEKAMYTMVVCWFFTLEKIILLILGIYHWSAQAYSNTLISSDVSIHCDTFGMMFRYSSSLYHPISTNQWWLSVTTNKHN